MRRPSPQQRAVQRSRVRYKQAIEHAWMHARTYSDVGELGVGVVAPDDDVLDLGCGHAGAVAYLVQRAVLCAMACQLE